MTHYISLRDLVGGEDQDNVPITKRIRSSLSQQRGVYKWIMMSGITITIIVVVILVCV
jgi:ABC-type glycerol-3-phosphate transport system permease component